MWNLKGIRDAIYANLDWAPDNAPEADARVNDFIHRGYMRMLQEAPFLFFEDSTTLTIEPVVKSADATDTLGIGDDAWTVHSTLPIPVATAWADEANDRVFDGRMLHVEDADGVWHQHQIREVWQEGIDGHALPLHWWASLVTPWKNASDENMSWRIQTDEFPLPQSVVDTRAFILRRDQLDYPLEVLGQSSAEYASLTNNARLLTSGVPRWVFRREHQQISAPTLKPTTSQSQDAAWVGTGVPTGTFQVCYTYVFGKNEVWQSAPTPATPSALAPTSDRYIPWWESGVSPVSDVFTATTGGAQTIVLPDIDHMLGFGDASTSRYHRAGIKKRIYIKQLTQTAGITRETPDTYFLYDEVDGHITSYEFDGARSMDFLSRLPEVHGYQTVSFYPTPDARYEVEVRVLSRPHRMTDDSDVPRIHADAIEALIYRAQAYLYESQGNFSASAFAMTQYDRSLHSLKQRYGDLRPTGRSQQRRPANVRRGRGLRRQLPIQS